MWCCVNKQILCCKLLGHFFFQFDFTALYFACMSGHAEIAKLLIDAGLDVNNQTPVSLLTHCRSSASILSHSHFKPALKFIQWV